VALIGDWTEIIFTISIMLFLRQTWALCQKTLLVVLGRHVLGTLIRAFFAPIIFMFFISYAKNFFVPPSDFGVGTATPALNQ